MTRRAFMPLAIKAVRMLERTCAPGVLSVLLWPAAAWRAARELRWRGPLPAAFLPATPRARRWTLWRQRVHLHLAQLMVLWPDRLGTARWQRRCDLAGIDAIRDAARRTPVVLVTLHFGPFALLKYCLRASGLPVAALVGRDDEMRPQYRRRLDTLSDRASGLSASPHLFDLSQIKAALRFVDEGGMLLMAIDGVHGHKTTVRHDDYALRLATGPVRIAARTGAVLIPCLAVPARWLGVRVVVGRPIECGPVDVTCAAIMREFAPHLKRHPAHWDRRLIRAFRDRVAVESGASL